jgi:hypothetical protein
MILVMVEVLVRRVAQPTAVVTMVAAALVSVAMAFIAEVANCVLNAPQTITAPKDFHVQQMSVLKIHAYLIVLQIILVEIVTVVVVFAPVMMANVLTQMFVQMRVAAYNVIPIQIATNTPTGLYAKILQTFVLSVPTTMIVIAVSTVILATSPV